MRKLYEAPQLTMIGEAECVVMGASSGASDNGHQGAWDFEFEPDWPLI